MHSVKDKVQEHVECAHKAWNLRQKKKLGDVFDKLLLTLQPLTLQYPTQTLKTTTKTQNISHINNGVWLAKFQQPEQVSLIIYDTTSLIMQCTISRR